MRTVTASATIFVAGGFLILFGLVYAGCIPRGPVMLVARGGAIILAASVALVPIYYPKHSPYTRRATHALEQIKDLKNHHRTPLATIDDSERGFNELISAIEEEHVEFQSHHTPIEIGHIAGTQEQLNEYFGSEVAIHPGNYNIIYVETEGDRPEGVSPRTPVLRTHFPPPIMDKLPVAVLERSIADTAQTRANRYTAGLAVMWSTVSILLTIYPVL